MSRPGKGQMFVESGPRGTLPQSSPNQPRQTALQQRPASAPALLSTNAIEIAAAPRAEEPGVVLDWILVSTTLININFGGGTGKTGPAFIGQGTNDFWNWCNDLGNGSIAMDELFWSDGSGSVVAMEADNGPGQWGNSTGDPMYDTYIYPYDGDINVWFWGLAAGTYDFYIYGHGPANNANSVFELWSDDTSYGQKGTTIWGSGWNSTSSTWEEGQKFVAYRNVTVSDWGVVLLDVAPGAAGLAILNGMQIVPSDAVPRDPPQMYQVLNVDLGGGSQKTGVAAVGLTSSDQWNWFNFPGQSSGALTNLSLADGTATSAGLRVTNAPGYWGSSTGDAMYDTYVYNEFGGHIGLLLTNLPGYGLNYDFYVYGHGPADDANGIFQLTTGGITYGPRGTTIWGEDWNSCLWEEGMQYVVFRNIPVTNGQPVLIDVAPGWSTYTIINGVQAVVPWDRDGNGLADWWEVKYFGAIGADANADYDLDGTSNLLEFEGGTDPNKISFQVNFPSDHFATTLPSGSIQVLGGVPAKMAVLLNSTNFASAIWQPFSSSITLSLGPYDGRYEIWIGLRGLPADAQQTWEMTPLFLDRAPPLLVLTQPASLTTSRPLSSSSVIPLSRSPACGSTLPMLPGFFPTCQALLSMSTTTPTYTTSQRTCFSVSIFP